MDATKNPFWVLRVALDDDAETVEQRLEELEDDEPDGDWRAFARRLQKPQERILCEVAWLPGLSAGEALQGALSALKGEHVVVGARTALADVNLRLMRLAASGQRELVEQLLGIASAWERVDPTAVTQQINAHRGRAGLRAKATDERVRAALQEHRAWVNTTVWEKACWSSIPAGRVSQEQAKELAKMVATIQTLSQTTTRNGQRRAPEMVREWVKKYEGEWDGQLGWQRTRMETLTKDALSALTRRDTVRAASLTEQVCKRLKSWDIIAQPIQLMYQGEGTTDTKTEAMFEIVRKFSLSLHNEHGKTALAAQVVETQRQVFKEAERLDQRLEQDETTLAGLLRELRKESSRTPRIEPFSGHIGVFRKVVEVTNERIRVGIQTIHPDEVTGLRWGVSAQGYLGQSYEIWIRGQGRLLHILTMRREIYVQVAERLLRGCGSRLIRDIVQEFEQGGTIEVGGITMVNRAVHLTRRHWLKASETAWVPFPQTEADVSDGVVTIRSRTDSKMKSSFSLRDDWNGVLLHVIMTRGLI